MVHSLPLDTWGVGWAAGFWQVHLPGSPPPTGGSSSVDDHDDNNKGPRPREEVPRFSRVCQLFPGCISKQAVRVRKCSPPTYRWALEGDMEPMDRGHTMQHSPAHSRREREYLQHASEEWEHRRWRSLASRGCSGRQHQALFLQDGHCQF